MNFAVDFTPQACEDLSQLDTAIAKRVVEKIEWLARHYHQIQLETLTGDFAHLYKLRVGNWRVLYTTDAGERRITIHVIAHRSKVYQS